ASAATRAACSSTAFLACRLRAFVRRLLEALSGALGGNGFGLRTTGRRAMEHALNAEVFVDVRPVHSLPCADDAKIGPLRRSGFRQPPGPCERHANDSA